LCEKSQISATAKSALGNRRRLVEDGYVTPQYLDKTLKDGLGLRWSFMGPFETIELNGAGRHPGAVGQAADAGPNR
jgi:hypothetical protein